jgi:hypothetical protein
MVHNYLPYHPTKKGDTQAYSPFTKNNKIILELISDERVGKCNHKNLLLKHVGLPSS